MARATRSGRALCATCVSRGEVLLDNLAIRALEDSLEKGVEVAERSAFAADPRGQEYVTAVTAAAEEAAASAPDGSTDAAYIAAVAAQTPSDVPAQAASVLFETATIDTPLTAQLRCIRRDFTRLKKLARKEKWTDDTPVPPEVFGPMWPEGVAPYWAVEPPPVN